MMKKEDSDKVILAYKKLWQTPNQIIDGWMGTAHVKEISKEDLRYLRPFLDAHQSITTTFKKSEFTTTKAMSWGEYRRTEKGEEHIYVSFGPDEEVSQNLCLLGIAIQQAFDMGVELSDLEEIKEES